MGTERALSEFRVIDFGQYVAGPAAAMMLADLGAEVIRVDPPGGPRWSSSRGGDAQPGQDVHRT